jgi:hypothetical protein
VTVPTAVAACLAVLGECDGVTVSRTHEAHSGRAELVALAEEAVRMAPIASEWSGYAIPPEIAFVTAFAEGGCHNLNRDHVRDPLHRSSGFFAMRPACYSKFARRAGLPFLSRDGLGLEEWSLEVCGHNRSHPIQQVRVYFTAAAYYLRAESGDVARFFSIWRWGYPTERAYADRCAAIWRRRFGSYPRGGKLSRR